ncbi:P-loop containing nucleoside triphosphate hydrolase protein [Mycena epipterygia]|nr:P-loop containing nucleoside triphosphate hydrolase protein [Mycena epipterygia]
MQKPLISTQAPLTWTHSSQQREQKTCSMFGAVRFASCLVLTCIAALQWFLQPELQPFTSLLTFIYASILSGLSIAFASWSQVFIGHVNLFLGLQTALYFYRDIYSLITFTKHPIDTEEGAYISVDPLNLIPPNAEQTASILSSYLFSFLDGLVYSANKRSKRDQEFSYEDLPTLADYSQASNLKKKSFPYLDEFHGAPKRHIFFGLLKTFRFRLVVAFVYIVMIEAEAIIISLVFEHAFRIRVKVETPNAPATPGSTPSSHTTSENTALKTAAVPPDSSNLIGKINNLIATDAITAANKGKDILRIVIYAPCSFLLGTYFLYSILGWSAFVGLGLMVLLAPVPGMVAKLTRNAKIAQLRGTDARVQKVTETMIVLRMVKLFSWMSFSEQQINEKREEELVWVKRAQLLNVFTSIIGKVLLTVSMICLFLFYLNNTRTGKVSLDRIDTFLHETELLDVFTAPTSEPYPDDPHERGIGFHNATFTWVAEQIDDQPTQQFKLRLDDLIFRPGLNIVTGPSASGKTSLLLALLGEMHFIPAAPESWLTLPRSNGVAYCDQTSWVLNDTIRNNILFGTPMDKERYKKVLYQCALEPDLALLEAGDQSEVGERGLTLSGGQRRGYENTVALARAVYSHASILLLDDVLAVLDKPPHNSVHTSVWIIQNCLSSDLLVGRAVILVTHNVDITAPIAVYCVNVRNGTVWDQGLVSEVMAANKHLRTAAEVTDETTEKVEDLVAAKEVARTEGGKLIVSEVAVGHVSWRSKKPYFVALIGNHTILLPIIYACCLFGAHIVSVVQKYYLGVKWSAVYEDHDLSEVSYIVMVPAAITVVALSFTSLDAILFMFGSIRGAKAVHKSLIASVLQTTLRWLDTTPMSRIIARCTSDVAALDGMLPGMLKDVIHVSFLTLVELFSIVLVIPQVLFVGTLVGFLGYVLGQIYISAQLGVKRHVSNAKAPILAHLGAAVGGLVSVRAYGAQEALISQSFSRLENYSRAIRPYENLLNWISTRLDILGGCFEASLAAYMVYFSSSGAAETGFCLAQAVSGQILWLVYSANELELSGEPSRSWPHIANALMPRKSYSTEAGKPPAYWPSSGDLRVDNLSARYSVEGPKVLENVSFHIRSGERIGVVGRTGSGKSSLMLSLLRCIYTEGTIYFDGIPTTKINLDALRSNITIIPQMPELLNASLRHNLDPFELYDDQTLNDALRAAGLFSLQDQAHEDRKFTLNSSIASGGGNMSVGERQIVALARAFKLSLRTEVNNDTTLLIIAHQLQLVLDSGRLVKFGTPKDLIAKENGKLRSLIHESADRDVLIEMADKAVGETRAGI